MGVFQLPGWKHTGIFAAGVAFGTAGIKLLSSKDAKRFYTSCTAAALRAKDCVMKTVSNIQENAQDIYEEAKLINEEREAEESAGEFEDLSEESAGEFKNLSGKAAAEFEDYSEENTSEGTDA